MVHARSTAYIRPEYEQGLEGYLVAGDMCLLEQSPETQKPVQPLLPVVSSQSAIHGNP